MFSRGGYDANAKRRRSDEAEKAFNGLSSFSQNDPEKQLVLTYIARLIADGYAEFDVQESGEIEVRFTSGEIYLLGEASILRLA